MSGGSLVLLHAMFSESFKLCSEVVHVSSLDRSTHTVKILLMHFLSRSLHSVLLMICKVIIQSKAIVMQ